MFSPNCDKPSEDRAKMLKAKILKESVQKTNFEKCNFTKALSKEIQIILRLFLVKPVQASFFSITHPLLLIDDWKGSLGTCSR